MNIKTKLLSFARLLKTFQEVQTQNGSLISDTEIIVGSEVFVADAEGNLIPAPTAVYEAGDVKYTVESGIVIAIETTALEEPIVEVLEEDEPIVDEPIEEVNQEVEDLKAENEALKAEIERLIAENEDLKKQLEEPVAEPIENQETVFSKQEKRNSKLEALAQAFKK